MDVTVRRNRGGGSRSSAQRTHAVHQGDTLDEIGDERRMGVRRQRPDPPVGGARLRMGEHGGSGWRDCWPGIARLLAGPLAVQGAELVVDVDQIAG